MRKGSRFDPTIERSRWHGRGHIKKGLEDMTISKYLGIMQVLPDTPKADCVSPTICETYSLLFTQPYISQNFVRIGGVKPDDVDFYGGFFEWADYCPYTTVRNKFNPNSSPFYAM